jgi:hypothetical protein
MRTATQGDAEGIHSKFACLGKRSEIDNSTKIAPRSVWHGNRGERMTIVDGIFGELNTRNSLLLAVEECEAPHNSIATVVRHVYASSSSIVPPETATSHNRQQILIAVRVHSASLRVDFCEGHRQTLTLRHRPGHF